MFYDPQFDFNVCWAFQGAGAALAVALLMVASVCLIVWGTYLQRVLGLSVLVCQALLIAMSLYFVYGNTIWTLPAPSRPEAVHWRLPAALLLSGPDARIDPSVPLR